MIEGGCLCGQVRYASSAEPLARTNCHCGDCRRAVGAGPAAWVILPVEGFAFRGEPVWFRSSSWAERGFCPRCGTSLCYRRDERPGDIDILTCTLDDPESLPPEKEIRTAEKLSWTPLNPGLPQFPGSSRKV
jgi:hypothetical protein